MVQPESRSDLMSDLDVDLRPGSQLEPRSDLELRSDLPLELRIRGRAPKQVAAATVRELTDDDLARLSEERGIKPPALARLRDAHHRIARLLAEGLPHSEISAIAGYSQSRISILKADPAFQELVEFYRVQVAEARAAAFAEGLARATAFRDDLLEHAHEQLLDHPETFDLDRTHDYLKLTMDRTGLGPATKATNVNINVGYAESVARGRARAARSWTEPSEPIELNRSQYTYTETEPVHRVEGSKKPEGE